MMSENLSNSEDRNHLSAAAEHIKNTTFIGADYYNQFVIFGFVALTLAVSPLYNTWFLGFTIGGLTLIAYLLTRFFKPGTTLLMYVTTFCYAVLSALLFAQVKGKIEFHFIYLIPLTSLLFYQKKRAYLFFAILIVFHHTLFLYLQQLGTRGIYLFPSSRFSVYFLAYYSSLFAAMVIFSRVNIVWQRELNQHKHEKESWENTNKNFNKNIEFAKEIASGNLDAAYDLSDGDTLGHSLLEMRENLKITSEEDRNRNWATQGVAKIEEILRLNNNNLENLSFTVISNLVKFLDANQGALFIISTDEYNNKKFLELKGCYAYEKKKHVEKKFEIGQGLLGQAVVEKDTLVLTEIPENYVQITSGLGEATPKCVVIVPLKIEEEVIGAIEIASFKKFQNFQVDYLKKVAESIASAVMTSKNNHRTSKLLEESRELSEVMKSQEEEMRQNMEELQATQEELQRNNSEFEEFMEIFNDYYVRIEYDVKGNILNASSKVINLTQLEKSEILNKKYSSILHNDQKEKFDDAFWKDIVKNKVNETNLPLRGKNGSIIWLKAYFKPVEYMPGFVRKVNMIGYPITVDAKVPMDSK